VDRRQRDARGEAPGANSAYEAQTMREVVQWERPEKKRPQRTASPALETGLATNSDSNRPEPSASSTSRDRSIGADAAHKS